MTFLFYMIALLITAATALAVTRRNMVHAVLYLVLSFFGTAMLFYLLGAPFLPLQFLLPEFYFAVARAR